MDVKMLWCVTRIYCILVPLVLRHRYDNMPRSRYMDNNQKQTQTSHHYQWYCGTKVQCPECRHKTMHINSDEDDSVFTVHQTQCCWSIILWNDFNKTCDFHQMAP